MRITLATLIFCAAISCGSPQIVSLPLPDGLVLLPGGARAKTESGRDGSVLLSYEMNREYPAQQVLDHLEGTLAKSGWRPLKTDWLNPGIPTVVRRWASFEDATKHPSVFVHQWGGDWEDAKGNIVTYFLRYLSKYDPAASYLSGPDNSTLHVAGLRTPKASVDRLRQSGASPKQ